MARQHGEDSLSPSDPNGPTFQAPTDDTGTKMTAASSAADLEGAMLAILSLRSTIKRRRMGKDLVMVMELEADLAVAEARAAQ